MQIKSITVESGLTKELVVKGKSYGYYKHYYGISADLDSNDMDKDGNVKIEVHETLQDIVDSQIDSMFKWDIKCIEEKS